MTVKTRPWYAIKWRNLSSFFLVFSSIVILVSGVVLYIAPIGRYAHSINWKFLWLEKGQWEALHTLFSYVAVIFSVIHLVVNWKVLMNYLWNRAKRAYYFPRELTLAVLLTVIVAVGTLMNVPPFSTVMDWGEALSAGWEAPVSQTEPLLTPIPPVDDEAHSAISAGWGRYTVSDLCQQEDISLSEGLSRLAAYGMEANAETRIRDLADSSAYAPSEVVDILRGLSPGTGEGGEH